MKTLVKIVIIFLEKKMLELRNAVSQVSSDRLSLNITQPTPGLGSPTHQVKGKFGTPPGPAANPSSAPFSCASSHFLPKES